MPSGTAYHAEQRAKDPNYDAKRRHAAKQSRELAKRVEKQRQEDEKQKLAALKHVLAGRVLSARQERVILAEEVSEVMAAQKSDGLNESASPAAGFRSPIAGPSISTASPSPSHPCARPTPRSVLRSRVRELSKELDKAASDVVRLKQELEERQQRAAQAEASKIARAGEVSLTASHLLQSLDRLQQLNTLSDELRCKLYGNGGYYWSAVSKQTGWPSGQGGLEGAALFVLDQIGADELARRHTAQTQSSTARLNERFEAGTEAAVKKAKDAANLAVRNERRAGRDIEALEKNLADQVVDAYVGERFGPEDAEGKAKDAEGADVNDAVQSGREVAEAAGPSISTASPSPSHPGAQSALVLWDGEAVSELKRADEASASELARAGEVSLVAPHLLQLQERQQQLQAHAEAETLRADKAEAEIREAETKRDEARAKTEELSAQLAEANAAMAQRPASPRRGPVPRPRAAPLRDTEAQAQLSQCQAELAQEREAKEEAQAQLASRQQQLDAVSKAKQELRDELTREQDVSRELKSANAQFLSAEARDAKSIERLRDERNALQAECNELKKPRAPAARPLGENNSRAN